MSLILDALRKSEHDRRSSDAVALGDLPMPPADSVAYPRWLIALIVLVVVGGAGAAAYFLIPSRQQPQTPELAIAPPPAPPVAPAAPEAAPAPVAASATSPPPLETNAFAPAAAESATHDLAQEAQVAAPKPKSPAFVAPAPVAVAAVPKVSAPTPPPIKFLRGMPPAFQKSLPELVMNIHVYSTVETERILYINNNPYVAGQKIRDDIVVEEIVPDGAVLSYRGQKFKLPRPS